MSQQNLVLNIINQLHIILELCKWKNFLILTSLLDIQYKLQDVYTSTNVCLSIVHFLSSICMLAYCYVCVHPILNGPCVHPSVVFHYFFQQLISPLLHVWFNFARCKSMCLNKSDSMVHITLRSLASLVMKIGTKQNIWLFWTFFIWTPISQ